MSDLAFSTDELVQEAKTHFEKLAGTLEYQEKKFTETHKPIVQKEIDALRFVIKYAKKALADEGIEV